MRRVLSLFSGAGGLDLGLEGGFGCLARSVPSGGGADALDVVCIVPRTGFETVFACDIRPDAKAAWEGYFGRRGSTDGTYHLDSIVDLVKAAKAGEFAFPSADVVTGGFPCNDFSVAGKRLGFESTKGHDGGKLEPDAPTVESRGMLYYWMREVVSLVLPKMFVAENVKGLVSLGDVKTIIEHDFSEAGGGYLVVPARVLYAPDYGVPQGRERVLFFGFRKDALTADALAALSSDPVPAEFDPYPPKTHGDGLEPIVTVREALAGLPEPEDADDPAQRKFSKAKFLGHSQGQSEVKLDSVGPTIRAEHHGNIEFRRLSAEHGGKHAEELAAGLKERRLTVRECARIQTFPDDYEFIVPGKVSASDAYKIIGNAVPPVLGYAVARNMAAKWGRWFGE